MKFTVTENYDVVEKARELNSGITCWGIHWNRVKNRQCYLSQPLVGNFQLIKSYTTIVGLIDNENRMFFEIGKYSSTTSKQLTMLHREQYSSYERHYVDGRV